MTWGHDRKLNGCWDTTNCPENDTLEKSEETTSKSTGAWTPRVANLLQENLHNLLLRNLLLQQRKMETPFLG